MKLGARRKNSGINPYTRPKGVSAITLTKEEWARVAALQEKYDATAGYLFAQAMRQWMGRRNA